MDETTSLLLVYDKIIRIFGVKAKALHQWQEKGILASMIKQTFDAELSAFQRQSYGPYLWFLQHQSIFNEPQVDDHTAITSWLFKSMRRTWKFIGRPDTDSDDYIRSSVAGFSRTKNNCFIFLNILLDHARPAPCDGSERWVSFGFCGCLSENDEVPLSFRYRELLDCVSFETFSDAYTSSSLAKLFSDNGLPITNRFVLDVLAGSPNSFKSVWWLKDFVCAEDNSARDSRPVPAVGVDYGFLNCKNVDEVIALRNAYKQVLNRTDSDPLALHEACLRGEIFEYLSRFTSQLKPHQLYKRLMKNPYPLPEY